MLIAEGIKNKGKKEEPKSEELKVEEVVIIIIFLNQFFNIWLKQPPKESKKDLKRLSFMKGLASKVQEGSTTETQGLSNLFVSALKG